MKKAIAAILSIFLLSMTACASDPTPASSEKTVSEQVSSVESKEESEESPVASSSEESSDVSSEEANVKVEHNYEKLTSLEGLKIVNFGDSIFGGFRQESGDRRSISSMLAEKTGATCINTAISGMTLAYNWFYQDYFSMHSMARYIKSGDFSPMETAFQKKASDNKTIEEVLQTLKQIDWSTVDVITVAYGTNDYGSVAVPITGNEESYKSKYFTQAHANKDQPDACTESTFDLAIRYTISAIHEAYPQIRIVMITPVHRFDMTADVKNDLGYTLSDYVERMKSISEEMGVACLDLYNECDIQEATEDKYFGTDKVHPNLQGREAMADYIAAHLLDALNSYAE